MRTRLRGLFSFFLVLQLVGVGGPLHAGELLGGEFEAFTGIPEEDAQAIGDDEMEDLRGGFLGFYFSLTGFAEADGAVHSQLDVNVTFGSQEGSLFFESQPGDGALAEGGGVDGFQGGPSVAAVDPVTGELFRVQTLIHDSFNGASGAFQIQQNAGNGVAQSQGLILNLLILQATDANMGAVQSRLDSLFGVGLP